MFSIIALPSIAYLELPKGDRCMTVALMDEWKAAHPKKAALIEECVDCGCNVEQIPTCYMDGKEEFRTYTCAHCNR